MSASKSPETEKRNESISKNREFPITFLISALFLLLFALVGHAFFPKDEATEQVIEISEMIDRKNKILQSKKPQHPTISSISLYTGTINTEDINIEIKLKVNNGDSSIDGTYLSFTQPPSPKLTDKEFVAGTKREPWITKLAFETENAIWSLEPSSSTYSTIHTEKVRTYLDANNSPQRAIMEVGIIGQFSKNTNELELTVAGVTSELPSELNTDKLLNIPNNSGWSDGYLQVSFSQKFTIKMKEMESERNQHS